jgi:quercetin dioxygenase-like cupin family protein
MLRVQIHSAAAKRPDDHDHYEGVVRFQHLDDPARGLRAIAVFFEPGSRTKPHTHDGDQLLVCLSGEGVVAIEGAAERIVPHDTVWIPKGTWHWHGASNDIGDVSPDGDAEEHQVHVGRHRVARLAGLPTRRRRPIHTLTAANLGALGHGRERGRCLT